MCNFPVNDQYHFANCCANDVVPRDAVNEVLENRLHCSLYDCGWAYSHAGRPEFAATEPANRVQRCPDQGTEHLLLVSHRNSFWGPSGLSAFADYLRDLSTAREPQVPRLPALNILLWCEQEHDRANCNAHRNLHLYRDGDPPPPQQREILYQHPAGEGKIRQCVHDVSVMEHLDRQECAVLLALVVALHMQLPAAEKTESVWPELFWSCLIGRTIASSEVGTWNRNTLAFIERLFNQEGMQIFRTLPRFLCFYASVWGKWQARFASASDRAGALALRMVLGDLGDDNSIGKCRGKLERLCMRLFTAKRFLDCAFDLWTQRLGLDPGQTYDVHVQQLGHGPEWLGEAFRCYAGTGRACDSGLLNWQVGFFTIACFGRLRDRGIAVPDDQLASLVTSLPRYHARNWQGLISTKVSNNEPAVRSIAEIAMEVLTRITE